MGLFNNNDGTDILGSILASAHVASTAIQTPTTSSHLPVVTDSSTDVVSHPSLTSSSAPSTHAVVTSSSTISSTTSVLLSTPTLTSTSSTATLSRTPVTTSIRLPSAVVSSVPSVSLVTASASSSAFANSASHTSSKSSAAIGVTVTIFILGICAASFFLIRKKYIDKRKRRRTSWNVPVISPKADTGTHSGKFRDLEAADYRNAGMEQFDTNITQKYGTTALPNNVNHQAFAPAPVPTIRMPAPLHPTGFAPPRMPSPPPVTVYSAEDQPSPIGVLSPSVGTGPAPLVTSTPFSAVNASQGANGNVVVVARTFIPTLPDELSIQTGEHVRILSRYDDGWCHVERLRSGAGVENGMVPSECLEVINTPIHLPAFPGMGLTQEAVEQWRLSKRESSLASVGPVRY